MWLAPIYSNAKLNKEDNIWLLSEHYLATHKSKLEILEIVWIIEILWILEILDILEILKILEILEIFEILEICVLLERLEILKIL